MAMPSILVVDGLRSVRFTLGGILEDEGYRVSVAKDGQEALRVVNEALDGFGQGTI